MEGHRHNVTCIAIHNDTIASGSYTIVSGSYDGTIKVWKIYNEDKSIITSYLSLEPNYNIPKDVRRKILNEAFPGANMHRRIMPETYDDNGDDGNNDGDDDGNNDGDYDGNNDGNDNNNDGDGVYNNDGNNDNKELLKSAETQFKKQKR
jgi:hypothetical protein